MHRIVSYGELKQHSEGGDLRGLSEFAQGWRRLQAGGLLLPDLVEFYRWLHTELCTYVVHFISVYMKARCGDIREKPHLCTAFKSILYEYIDTSL